jgi:hypothetical protein
MGLVCVELDMRGKRNSLEIRKEKRTIIRMIYSACLSAPSFLKIEVMDA